MPNEPFLDRDTFYTNNSYNSEAVYKRVAEIDADLETKGNQIGSLLDLGDTPRSLSKTLSDILIDVKDFGVKGDGTDETTKIQEASDYCAANKKILAFPAGIYGVSTILPKEGIIGYWSLGATLKAIVARSGEGMIASNLTTQVNNYFIKGFTFDCNGLSRRAVFAYGSKIKVVDNVIFGLDNPTNSEQAIRFYWDSSNNLIENNHITLGIDQPFGTFPSLIGINITGKYTSVYAGLDTGTDVPSPTNVSMYNTVRNNTIIGGTHGVSLMAAEHNKVYGNTLERQTHRNIILSPQASHNKIFNNDCINFGSAGVHLAYGSSDNKISDNKMFSDGTFMIGSGGEGAIQAYVHCKNNQIVDNKIYTRSTRYGIYTAIHCNGTNIQGNEVDGGLLAGVAVESDWQSPIPSIEKYGRPNYISPPNPSWTTWDNGKKMEYITVKGNTIYRNQLGMTNCGIYIGQSQNAQLNNLVIDDNTIHSANTSGDDFYVFVNDDTKFNNNIIKRNDATPLEVLQITFTNKNIKLLSYENNNWQNRLNSISVATNILDISKADNHTFNVACTIDTIEGIMVDSSVITTRKIMLKLYPGVVITHNSAKIRLQGDTNFTATSSNQIMEFVVISGILFEKSRRT